MKKQEDMNSYKEKNQSIKTNPEMTQMIDKGIKTVVFIFCMFKMLRSGVYRNFL